MPPELIARVFGTRGPLPNQTTRSPGTCRLQRTRPSWFATRTPVSAGSRWQSSVDGRVRTLLATTALPNPSYPCSGVVKCLVEDMRVCLAGASWNVEGMISLIEQFQRHARTQRIDQGKQQPRVRQGVACPLQKQHWDINVGQMSCPLVRRLVRGMQWKPEEDQPSHARQRRCRLRLRRHSSAERLAAREQWQPGRQPARCRHGRANGRMRERGPVRPFRSRLHVGKLVTQRRNVPRGQPVGDRHHEPVSHSRPRAMGQDTTGEGVLRPLQQARHPVQVIDLDGDRIDGHVRCRRDSRARISPTQTSGESETARIRRLPASGGRTKGADLLCMQARCSRGPPLQRL